MSLSEHVHDTLALLRGCRLSPFDLVLEILDEYKPEYSYYQTEFYKEGNEKLSKILDAIVSSGQGRSKQTSTKPDSQFFVTKGLPE
jgi:hypothetical protein